MTDLYAVHVRELRVLVSIGIYDFERKAPQEIVLSVCMVLERSDFRDAIDQVQDYDFIRTKALELASRGHFELQETFCAQLLDACMAQSKVLAAIVRTEKSTVYPDAKGVGCTMASTKPGCVIPTWMMSL